MATQQIPIIGPNTLPDTSGNVYYEPYANHSSNDRWLFGVFTFTNSGADDDIYGVFRVPNDYVDTANIVLEWTSAATSGIVVWKFDYRAVAGDDSESLDQAGEDESVSQNDTAPTATDRKMQTTIAVTDGNFTAGDIVEFSIGREGTSGSDTLADEVLLVGAYFQYADA